MKRPMISMLFLAASSLAHAASFDCTKATTAIEKTICSDGQLSDLDGQLGQTYKKNLLPDSSNSDNINADQRLWLANVRNKCQDTACLKQAYADRITLLNNVGRPSIVQTNTQQKPSSITAAADSAREVNSASNAPKETKPWKAARKQKFANDDVEIPPPAPDIPDTPLLKQQKNWISHVRRGETASSTYNKAIHQLKVNRDRMGAADLLKYSAYLGNIDAAELLGELYLTGLANSGSEMAKPLESKKLFLYADKHGNAQATIQLGKLIKYGDAGEKKDINQAISLFERAAKNGGKAGIWELANIAAFVDAYAGPKASPEIRKLTAERFEITRENESAAFAALARLGVSATEARKMVADGVEAGMQRRSDDCKKGKELHALNLEINHLNDGFQGCQ